MKFFVLVNLLLSVANVCIYASMLGSKTFPVERPPEIEKGVIIKLLMTLAWTSWAAWLLLR